MTIVASDGFFAHHGLWAPGVRAFRKLHFKSKAGLISLAFMVPMLLLAYLYVAERLELVRSANGERDGVAYVMQGVRVIVAASDLRRHSLREAGRQPADVAQARREFDEQLTKLAELDRTLGARLETTAHLAKVMEAAKALPAPTEGVMKVYAGNSRLLDALYHTIDQAADGSGLSLDPDLDTYQLMTAGAVELPRFVGLHTRMGDLASTVAASGQGGDVAAVELARLDAIAESRAEVIAASLRKVIGEHPELKAALDFDGVSKRLTRFREEALEEPGKGGPERSAKLDAARQDVAAAIRDLRQRTLVELDRLLLARIGRVHAHMALVLSIIGLFILGAAYLFTAFFLVMHGGLAKMRRHLDKITAGDLTDLPEPWGADEAAALMHAMRATQESLQQIVGKVRGAADMIASASGQIAGGANDMSGRTEQAAGSLQQTSSSMQEVLSEVNRTAEVTGEAARLAVDNARVAGEGGAIIGQMVTTMDAINDSSRRITDILGVIDGIAFQTNILALNAAVEAARAGEQGRGFAVVAAEVRALAHRSSDSAKQIKTLIGSSVERVEAGAQVVRQAGDTMDRIVANARQIQGMLDGIAIGAQTQGRNLDEVGVAVRQLDDSTQQNAALSEQTAAAAASLNEQARRLVDEVARFKLVG